MKKVILTYLACLLLVAGTVATGCSDSNEAIPVVNEPVIEEPACPNPIASEPQIFGEGNDGLYKPVSDSDGNVVVLLPSKFESKFDRCRIKTGRGEFKDLLCNDFSDYTQIPFSCKSNPVGNNPPRLTYRSSVKCQDVFRVEVVCQDACQQVTFKAPQGSLRKVCERFG